MSNILSPIVESTFIASAVPRDIVGTRLIASARDLSRVGTMDWIYENTANELAADAINLVPTNTNLGGGYE